MIKLGTLEVEGFGSIISPITYKLDNKGVTILSGKNGAGKSTIIEALIWAIYGVVNKVKITPWPDVQGENFRGTKVTLNLKCKIGVLKIIRCRDYLDKIGSRVGKNRLILYINGKEFLKYKNKGDLDKYIIKLIGIKYDVFINSIVLGQNLTRLLDQSGEKQKAILDQVFNTIYITEGREKAKKDYNQLNLNLSRLENELNSHQEIIANSKNNLKELKRVYKSLKKEVDGQSKKIQDKLTEKLSKTNDLGKLNDLVTKLNKKIELIKLKKDKSQTQLEKIKSLENEEFKVSLKIAQLEGDIADFKNLKKSLIKRKGFSNTIKCKECGQVIRDEKLLKAHVKNEILKLSKAIEVKQKELEQEQTSHSLITSSISKLDKYKSIHKYHVNLLDSLENKRKQAIWETKSLEETKREIGELKRELSELGKSLPNHKRLIKRNRLIYRDKKKHAEGLKADIIPVKKELKLLEWVINDPLSNRGLKAYIFNSLLSNITDRSKYYSRYSGISLNLGIDLNSSNKTLTADILIGDKIRPYVSLSGGQKQLANITLSLAIHDIVCQEANLNILFFDEIFENLDRDNIQIVSELISQMGSDKSLHLITHRSEFTLYNSNIIKFKLDSSGATKIAA